MSSLDIGIPGAVVLGMAGIAAVASLAEFVMYGVDKGAARRGGGRIPERTLLVVALAGGWVGAVIGARVFRHKTRKQPFVAWMRAVGVAHACAFAGVVIWTIISRLMSK